MWILEVHNPAANYNNYRGGGGVTMVNALYGGKADCKA